MPGLKPLQPRPNLAQHNVSPHSKARDTSFRDLSSGGGTHRSGTHRHFTNVERICGTVVAQTILKWYFKWCQNRTIKVLRILPTHVLQTSSWVYTLTMYSNLGPVEGEDEGDCGETLPETVTFIISQHFSQCLSRSFTFVYLYYVFSQWFWCKRDKFTILRKGWNKKVKFFEMAIIFLVRTISFTVYQWTFREDCKNFATMRKQFKRRLSCCFQVTYCSEQ
jgi:hypothetical protein